MALEAGQGGVVGGAVRGEASVELGVRGTAVPAVAGLRVDRVLRQHDGPGGEPLEAGAGPGQPSATSSVQEGSEPGTGHEARSVGPQVSLAGEGLFLERPSDLRDHLLDVGGGLRGGAGVVGGLGVVLDGQLEGLGHLCSGHLPDEGEGQVDAGGHARPR